MKRISVIFNLFFALLLIPMALHSQSIKVGIVKDASGNEFDILTRQVKSEIEALANAGDSAVFKELNANWQSGKKSL